MAAGRPLLGSDLSSQSLESENALPLSLSLFLQINYWFNPSPFPSLAIGHPGLTLIARAYGRKQILAVGLAL